MFSKIKNVLGFLKKDFVVTEDGFVVEKHLAEERFMYDTGLVSLKGYKRVYFKLGSAPVAPILTFKGAKQVALFDVDEKGNPVGFIRVGEKQLLIKADELCSLQDALRDITEKYNELMKKSKNKKAKK